MTAWWAVIGTLGGVVVTAVFSLATTYLNHRWADRSFDAQQQATARSALRAVRREVYKQYLVAVQSFYDKSDKLYFKNREQPIDPEEYRKKPDEELQPVRAAYEMARVDALLVADAGVRDAIEAYEDVFGELWPKAASGTDRAWTRPALLGAWTTRARLATTTSWTPCAMKWSTFQARAPVRGPRNGARHPLVRPRLSLSKSQAPDPRNRQASPEAGPSTIPAVAVPRCCTAPHRVASCIEHGF